METPDLNGLGSIEHLERTAFAAAAENITNSSTKQHWPTYDGHPQPVLLFCLFSVVRYAIRSYQRPAPQEQARSAQHLSKRKT
ncbi:uncharacterized protein SPSK_08201 [Sporothrix schenckii 1099-18]|uniref:Uncharacterized protein n=1 Tax=Sporothrix schenckii 1099-18 TaxID=1397361 RepID=A0A0F2MGB0_SPOSC|nr:uncharacterized protein SPSK_08201 [Sporothrix schenckii 1099-18]KJR87890.1 hypothetical protein SPSK_08201 [Sporothrix schenckii 1099-18]